MYKIVFLRHGESLWNQENRFTGWVDVDLSAKGLEEAKAAGQILKKEGYSFDLVFSSLLKRAIRTLWIVQEQMDLLWLPVIRAWQLNERHYGALQGLNKKETAEKYGEKQVLIWRRSYDTLPPLLPESDPSHPSHDPRYKTCAHPPSGEALLQTVERIVPYWENVIVPELKAKKKILVVAHGNSLRALIKHLDKVSNDDIVELNIPTGIPLLYELDANFKPIGHRYLGDEEAAKQAAAAVASQGKAK